MPKNMDNWIKKDLKYIWHPYTQMKDCQKNPPILIEKASGLKLYDSRGNFYYDTISSWWCNVHGHNHPKIKKAIKQQLNSLEHVLFAGFTHKPAILLADKLISIAPKNLNKIFFSDNGSTSVEVALKMSFQYWQNIGRFKKTKFIALDYAYHGDTMGAMSVSGLDIFNKKFQALFFPSFKVPSPYCYRCPMDKDRATCKIDCTVPLENLLREKAKFISAIILEPLVLAAGGMIVYPKEYLLKIANLAKEFNIHLILDEVATGFGRTGKMFAAEFVNDIEPDFMCLSKGLTSGYLPMGVTLTTNKIYKAFYADYEKRKTFYHGHTYTANPLSCSAALASLEIFEEENTLERIKEIIPLFHKGLQDFRDLPWVGDVRYIGLIGALELVKDKLTHSATSPNACHWGIRAVSPPLWGSRPETPFGVEGKGLNDSKGLSLSVSTLSISRMNPEINLEDKPRCLPSGYTNVLTKKSFSFKERIGLEIYKRGLKKHLILRPLGNIIYLFLPLCIKRKELKDILEKTYSVIKSL